MMKIQDKEYSFNQIQFAVNWNRIAEAFNNYCKDYIFPYLDSAGNCYGLINACIFYHYHADLKKYDQLLMLVNDTHNLNKIIEILSDKNSIFYHSLSELLFLVKIINLTQRTPRNCLDKLQLSIKNRVTRTVMCDKDILNDLEQLADNQAMTLSYNCHITCVIRNNNQFILYEINASKKVFYDIKLLAKAIYREAITIYFNYKSKIVSAYDSFRFYLNEDCLHSFHLRCCYYEPKNELDDKLPINLFFADCSKLRMNLIHAMGTSYIAWGTIEDLELFLSETQLKIDKPWSANGWESLKELPLNLAVQLLRTDIVRLLLEKYQVNPNHFFNLSALHYATLLEDHPTIELLLSHDACPNSKTINNQTPLFFLFLREIFLPGQKIDLFYQIQINIFLNETLKVFNCTENFEVSETNISKIDLATVDTSILLLLLDEIKDINHQDDYGQSIFHLAAITGDINTCNLLITRGSDINLQTNQGWAALHFACARNDVPMVNLLLKNNIKLLNRSLLQKILTHSCNEIKELVEQYKQDYIFVSGNQDSFDDSIIKRIFSK